MFEVPMAGVSLKKKCYGAQMDGSGYQKQGRLIYFLLSHQFIQFSRYRALFIIVV